MSLEHLPQVTYVRWNHMVENILNDDVSLDHTINAFKITKKLSKWDLNRYVLVKN